MKVKIKKLDEKAIIPRYAKPGDAGMDLTAVDVDFNENFISYKTGLAIEIPEGYVGLLFPRSSNSKKDLILTNSVGVIDSGYRGEIEFRYKWIGHNQLPNINNPNIYKVGERVGQLIIIPYPSVEFEEVTELTSTERGDGGFGHSGV